MANKVEGLLYKIGVFSADRSADRQQFEIQPETRPLFEFVIKNANGCLMRRSVTDGSYNYDIEYQQFISAENIPVSRMTVINRTLQKRFQGSYSKNGAAVFKNPFKAEEHPYQDQGWSIRVARQGEILGNDNHWISNKIWEYWAVLNLNNLESKRVVSLLNAIEEILKANLSIKGMVKLKQSFQFIELHKNAPNFNFLAREAFNIAISNERKEKGNYWGRNDTVLSLLKEIASVSD